MTENEVSYQIRGAIFDVYNELGPGLLESVYEEAMAFELKKRGLSIQQDVHYKQLLTYLKLMKKELGLLVNFNTDDIRYDIKRVVNGL